MVIHLHGFKFYKLIGGIRTLHYITLILHIVNTIPGNYR